MTAKMTCFLYVAAPEVPLNGGCTALYVAVPTVGIERQRWSTDEKQAAEVTAPQHAGDEIKFLQEVSHLGI